jgi:CBS domain-containing protein
MPSLADIMRPELIEAAPEDTLGEVAERMTAINVGAVAVKDFGRLIGILTERDMLKAMAARVMLENGFRHLPVVDENGQVISVVSLRRVVGAAKATPA